MAGTVAKQKQPSPPIPIAPSVEAWRAMSPAEQLAFQLRVLDALSDPALMMSEGRPHKKAKTRALDALNLHFRAMGRTVYLAEEMAVMYPSEVSFSPDLLAVLDVAEPEEDERMAWVVADEGKGLDLVLEVLHKGDREKDLVENVERYARLGIPEYFVYDHGRQQIHGFRLGEPGLRRYQRIVPQLGHYHSNVLGLDLTIISGVLRFLVGEAELPGSADLIRRLQSMAESLSTKIEQAEARADEARAGAASAKAGAVLSVLEARGIAVPDADRARILAETRPELLERLLRKASVAPSLAEVMSELTVADE